MKINLNSFLGVMAGILIATPNITWAVYLPLAILFIVISTIATNIKTHSLIILGGLIATIFISTIFEPRSTKYSLFFLLILIFYINLASLYLKNQNFSLYFLWSASLSLVATVIIGLVGLPDSLLQSRPEFDSYLFGVLRQRGLYTEPAYLGYWSALLFVLAYQKDLTLCMCLFALCFVLASSTGAMMFLILLALSQSRKFTILQIAFLIILLAIMVYSFWDIAVSKLISISYENRLANFATSYQFVTEEFPRPMGFGPIFVGNNEIGVTSFALLALKALGVFLIPFSIYVLIHVRSFLSILPLSFVIAAVGNFWEMPILFFLLAIVMGEYSGGPAGKRRALKLANAANNQ